MTSMDGEDLQRLWSLIDDLTNQLNANRQLCESLQQQADQLRGHALHSGTGFALRRFNTDVSKEQFESELEALNVHLVKEHLMITHENKQQAMLLREYENTLETIMAKFRTFSHSTQQHTLRLTQHYETLLANTTHASAEQTLAAETAFSGTLTHLGGLVRRAMQSLDGEEDSDTPEERVSAADPRWYGSGGYTGKTTDPTSLRAERALETLTEQEQLRLENETLRQLLQLKDKSDALLTAASTTAAEPLSPAPPAEGETVRRTSLTVDQASVAAEASGQPPSKALSVSSTLKPGQQQAPNSPSAHPQQPRRLSATSRDRHEQIIEDAILADDTDHTSSAIADDDDEEEEEEDEDERVPGQTQAVPATSLLRNTTEDVDAIHAEFQPDHPTAEVPRTPPTMTASPPPPAKLAAAARADSGDSGGSGGGGGGGGGAADLQDSVDAAATPNLVAEAAPPALVSTGLPSHDEDGDHNTTTTTSVTSVSGPDSNTIDPSPPATTTKSQDSPPPPAPHTTTTTTTTPNIPAEPTDQHYNPATTTQLTQNDQHDNSTTAKPTLTSPTTNTPPHPNPNPPPTNTNTHTPPPSSHPT